MKLKPSQSSKLELGLSLAIYYQQKINLTNTTILTRVPQLLLDYRNSEALKVGISVHSCREEWTFLARLGREEWTVLASFGRDKLVQIVLGGMDSFG